MILVQLPVKEKPIPTSNPPPILVISSEDDGDIPEQFPFPRTFGSDLDAALASIT